MAVSRDLFADVVGQSALDLEGKRVMRPLENVAVNVYAAGTTTPQTIYTGRFGATTKANPFYTDSTGAVEFWADPGQYDIFLDDQNVPARIADKTIGWTAVEPEWDLIGTFASRPPAGTAGRRYVATDTSIVYYDTGSTWIVSKPGDAVIIPEMFSVATAMNLGINIPTGGNAVTYKGKAIIPTTQGSTNTGGTSTYVWLATPDRVTVSLPSEGLIFLTYRALIQGTSSANAAIFVGSDQLKVPRASGVPIALATAFPTDNVTAALYSHAVTGLHQTGPGGTGTSFVSTGQLFSHQSTTGVGPIVIEASAGTYDVGVKYASGGTSWSVHTRYLRVWTMAF